MSAIAFDRPTPVKAFGIATAGAAGVFLDLVVGGLHAAELTAGLAVAVIAIVAAARRPGVAMGIIVIFVPLQVAVLAYVYRLGAPTRLVKDLGYFKDAMTLGICIAAMMARSQQRPRRGFNRLEWFAAAYVGIATIYLALPSGFPGSLGGQSFNVRLNAWRLDCLFVILMVAASQIHFSPSTLVKLRRVAIGTAVIICGVGLWEFFSGTGYNHFLVNTLRVPNYQAGVLQLSPPPNANYAAAFTSAGGGGAYSRIGSLLLNPLDMGFYTVVPFALATERLLRSGAGLVNIALTALTGFVLVVTETRSAVLAGGVAVICCLALNLRHSSPKQLRAAVLVILALALAVPLSAHSTIRARFSSLGGDNQALDNQQHSDRTAKGWQQVTSDPTGRGLGANPASGDRYGTTNATTTENSYLQVATELGVAAMIAFVGMYLLLLQRLYRYARAVRAGPAANMCGAAWAAGCGLLVGGMFLQVWIGLSVSLTFWGLAGAALGGASRPAPADA